MSNISTKLISALRTICEKEGTSLDNFLSQSLEEAVLEVKKALEIGNVENIDIEVGNLVGPLLLMSIKQNVDLPDVEKVRERDPQVAAVEVYLMLSHLENLSLSGPENLLEAWAMYNNIYNYVTGRDLSEMADVLLKYLNLSEIDLMIEAVKYSADK